MSLEFRLNTFIVFILVCYFFLSFCLYLFSYLFLFIYIDNLRVRLVGGNSRCAGRVEVLHRGQWGTVCGVDFDMADAAVVCRELDCGEPIHLCPTSLYKNHCSDDHFQGLFCSLFVFFCDLDRKNVRLVDGSSPCAGRVEVLHRGQWGTVCGDFWDMADAAVVCRELDCGEPVDALGGAHFGSGSGPIWMSAVVCTGSESTLKNCGSAGWSIQNVCTPNLNAGVICSGYTDLRLINGADSCSGRVELQFFNEWGTVCDACWDMRAASVLCRQLNCGIAVSVVGSDWFGEGSGEIWADVFDCDGNETKLSECSISSWSRAECSHRQDAGVICSSESFHLFLTLFIIM
uniref:SRCR domain-containing protein n=1 Tax=Sinocyclocheilus anshuiensis TaxID=1608454 RepID=A0A671QXM6_9TELE